MLKIWLMLKKQHPSCSGIYQNNVLCHIVQKTLYFTCVQRTSDIYATGYQKHCFTFGFMPHGTEKLVFTQVQDIPDISATGYRRHHRGCGGQSSPLDLTVFPWVPLGPPGSSRIGCHRYVSIPARKIHEGSIIHEGPIIQCVLFPFQVLRRSAHTRSVRISGLSPDFHPDFPPLFIFRSDSDFAWERHLTCVFFSIFFVFPPRFLKLKTYESIA